MNYITLNPAIAQCRESFESIRKDAAYKQFKAIVQNNYNKSFHEYKIKKSEFFTDPAKAPEWLEDEFVIADQFESDKIKKGVIQLVPFEVLSNYYRDGTVNISEIMKEKHKDVIIIMGTKI